jgi:hypothetical protein
MSPPGDPGADEAAPADLAGRHARADGGAPPPGSRRVEEVSGARDIGPQGRLGLHRYGPVAGAVEEGVALGGRAELQAPREEGLFRQ